MERAPRISTLSMLSITMINFSRLILLHLKASHPNCFSYNLNAHETSGRRSKEPSKFARRTQLNWSGPFFLYPLTPVVIIAIPEESMHQLCDTCRACRYGGEDEYWVETRETGERGQERVEKKERKEVCKDWDHSSMFWGKQVYSVTLFNPPTKVFGCVMFWVDWSGRGRNPPPRCQHFPSWWWCWTPEVSKQQDSYSDIWSLLAAQKIWRIHGSLKFT